MAAGTAPEAVIYLDHAATTPVRPEVLEAMVRAYGRGYGNPSSVHAAGRAARQLVDQARDQLASVLGCRAREIVFTSGGSEADNLALRGVAHSLHDRGRHLVVSAIEHEAVLETARDLRSYGFEVTELPVDGEGTVFPEQLAAAMRDDTILVSVMLANNEVGTIEPVAALAEVAHRNPLTLFHSDATQALGKLPISVSELGVDLLTVSAHKIYGPKGAGALYVAKGTPLDPVLTGGGQERTRRSGTENVAGIVGFGVAAELAASELGSEMERQGKLARRLSQGLQERLPEAIPTGAAQSRLPNFCSLALPGVEGELLLLRLDRAGVCASAGSACTSGSMAPSHVLLAMGLPPRLAGAHLRLTVGRGTTEEEIDRAVEIIAREVGQLQGPAGPSLSFAAGVQPPAG